MTRVVPSWIFFFTSIGIYYNVTRLMAQDVKTWNVNNNFDNPRNWKDGRLPCANDRVIFPESKPVLTLMPESFAVAEMVLPVNGELIFPENGAFGITGGNQGGSCVGKDAYFTPSVDFWFNPSNWNITSDRVYPNIPSRRNLAVPHAFQVPCRMDKVHFPPGASFTVHLDYPSTSIGKLRINNIDYSQSDFDSLLSSHIGGLLFPDNPRIQITPSECTDDSGCPCGNDDRLVLPTICTFTVPYPDAECEDPIQPVGHCYPMCGASIIVETNSRFRIDNLLLLHKRFLTKGDFQGVESFTSKTLDGKIQSVFVDGTRDKGRAHKIAQLIHDEILADMTGSGMYRIRSAELHKSGRWGPGIPTYDAHSSGMSSGGVVALVIIIIVGTGLAAAFYVYKKRQIPGFSFARFDLNTDKIELELGTTPHDELQPGEANASSSSEEKAKSFDNPVYGSPVTDEVPPASPEESPEVRDFVENPMFMIFEDSTNRKGGE